jgi:hypothetical protein
MAGRHSTRGIMLMECIVYLSVFFLVAGLALAAFYRALDFTRALRRTSGEISLALDAGERWRADLRAATGPVRVTENDGINALHIPRGADETVYSVSDGGVRRRAGRQSPEVQVLSGIKNARFVRDQREHVIAWRWELELKTNLKAARLRPLFSFVGAAPAEQSQ